MKILDQLEESMKNKNLKSMASNITVLQKEFKIHSLNKEEKALFPELEEFILRDGGPTGVMVMEHKELAGLVKDFKVNLKTGEIEKLNRLGNNICSVLRPHIDKENNTLFMMNDMHLNEKQKKNILEKFKKFDLNKGN